MKPDATRAPTVAEILAERDKCYGRFMTYAKTAYELRRGVILALQDPATSVMPYDGGEALHAIVGKMARILTGDPEYRDNWADIAGYAQLVLNRIDEEKGNG